MSASVSRKETERTKLIQEKCQTLLTQMLRDEDNKYCVDCDAKGPRWASWNLGVFLCIRCAGIHRNLGVHISRVKSVNLDTWTPEQVISLQLMGNSRARAVYEAQLPDGFRRPQTDNALESFIRAKYEHKKYLAREWVAPSPPKVDWAKEIDEELEKQKRKKKSSQSGGTIGLGAINNDKKLGTTSASSTVRSVPLPAPLAKPKPGQSNNSPKAQAITLSSNSNSDQQANDLLGLSSPTRPVKSSVGSATQDLQNDGFGGFFSASASNTPTVNADSKTERTASPQSSTSVSNLLAKEEDDFFNRGNGGAASANGDKDKSGKLTKDNIMALYGASSATGKLPNHQMNFVPQTGQQSLYSQNSFGSAGLNISFLGMTPGFIGSTTSVQQPQHQQQQQHPQFMTPPNSVSMYNTPVMTAPTAFSTPGIGGLPMGSAGAVGGYGMAQFHGMAQNIGQATYPAQMPATIMQSQSLLMGSGIMAAGQAGHVNGINVLPTNQSVMGGIPLGPMANIAQQQQAMSQMPGSNLHAMSTLGGSLQIMGGVPPYQGLMGSNASTSVSTANLNQQFSNLNIGNVWQ